MRIDKNTIYFEKEDCTNIENMVNEMRGYAIEEDADIFEPSEVPLLYIVKAYVMSKGYDASILKRKQIIGDNEDNIIISAILTHCFDYLLIA
ncbi:hypothetical protein I5677_08850 [Mobilitalea sibirica]|uniref:Uncharacterized protein n=1 Tax=Mobilitalea sibirica TaxID=1462919 RepID=A0A8J7H2J5_9FIRM|nr:hypothetical protein [Mobilitalea sibirica]MBH1940997.1 hypothetical protein [Mobilitalea sibirica]